MRCTDLFFCFAENALRQVCCFLLYFLPTYAKQSLDLPPLFTPAASQEPILFLHVIRETRDFLAHALLPFAPAASHQQISSSTLDLVARYVQDMFGDVVFTCTRATSCPRPFSLHANQRWDKADDPWGAYLSDPAPLYGEPTELQVGHAVVGTSQSSPTMAMCMYFMPLCRQ